MASLNDFSINDKLLSDDTTLFFCSSQYNMNSPGINFKNDLSKIKDWGIQEK